MDLWDRHAGAVHAYAVVQCSRGDRLRLLDVGRDRWLDLPLQPKPVVTSLWNGRDLYAITADGHLLVLR